MRAERDDSLFWGKKRNYSNGDTFKIYQVCLSISEHISVCRVATVLTIKAIVLSTAFLRFSAVQTLTCSKITDNSKQKCFKDVQEVIQQEEVAAQQGRGCTRIRSGDFLTPSPALLLLLNPSSQLLF